MRWADLKTGLWNFWREFRKVKFGVVGLVLLLLFVVLVIAEPFIIPYSEASRRWRDITYWQDSPKSAEPIWVNWLSPHKRALTQTLTQPTMAEETAGAMTIKTATFDYYFLNAVIPPSDVILHCPMKGAVTFVVSLVRPDGRVIEIAKRPVRSSGLSDARFSADMESKDAAFTFATSVDTSATAGSIHKATVKASDVLFGVAEAGILRNPKPLNGMYQLVMTAYLSSSKDTIGAPYVVVPGRVSGLLGTDEAKRDLWSGVVVGTKWALVIGLLTSFISVVVGVIYGVVCAYYGGWVDSLMQRVFEVFINIPLLPVLIVVSAVLKPNLWFLILVMSVFFWVGPVKTVRSMALQIKEETYIEAARGLGASHGRIIFKHMIPQLIPYSFATMALSVPGAIVFESAMSLLGLGDPTVVTWGQILRDAVGGGAVLNGLWWWVVPPGLAIAFMGMTFAFVGFAMDAILHPKLRTR